MEPIRLAASADNRYRIHSAMRLHFWPNDTRPQPPSVDVTAWMEMRGWIRDGRYGWVKRPPGSVFYTAVQGDKTWERDAKECRDFENIIIQNGWKQ